MAAKPRVAIYARVSTGKQKLKDISTPDQIRRMRECCDQKGFEVVRIWEEGKSGRDDNRPAFREMIAEALSPKRPYDIIMTLTTSRFFRNATTARVFKESLKKAGVRVVAMHQEVSNDPNGRFIEGIFELVDQLESDNNAFHTLRGMEENARRGNFNGSRTPYGYQAVTVGTCRRIEIKEDEADIVRLIFSLYLGKDGISRGVKCVASYLNERNIRCRGRLWSKGYIYDILNSSRYFGTAYFNRREGKTGEYKPLSDWIEYECPAIIDKTTFDLAQKRFKSRSISKVSPSVLSTPTLLTGLIECGCCGAGMTTATGKGGRYRYYKCNNRISKSNDICTSSNLPMEDLNELVIKSVRDYVMTPERIGTILHELIIHLSKSGDDEKELARLRKQLTDAQNALIRLTEAYEQGALPLDILKSRNEVQIKIRQESEAAISVLAAKGKLIPNKPTDEQVKRFCSTVEIELNNSDSPLRKEFLRTFVRKVIVKGQQIIIKGNSAVIASAVASVSAQNKSSRGANNIKALTRLLVSAFFVTMIYATFRATG